MAEPEGARPAEAADLARTALALLACDPALGLRLRMRAGPQRDAILDALDLGGAPRRITPATDPERLTGGLDLAATLAAGLPIHDAGLFAEGRPLILAMAERSGPRLAALLAGAAADGLPLAALDEGIDGEAPPPALTEALGLHLFADRAPEGLPEAAARGRAARARRVALGRRPEDAVAVSEAAAALGVPGMTAPLLALRAARAHAALTGRDAPGPEDLAAAVALVLLPRATRLPAPPEEDAPAPEEAPPPPEGAEGADDAPGEMAERAVEAAAALLPPGVLAALAAGRMRAGPSSGAGAARVGPRGRPLPARPGRLGSGARPDLVATLRAAAPWQPIRRARPGETRAVVILPADIRLRRAEERAERCVIFAVDASGSAAAARLAEAKGAVERLLADAYAARDRVALVVFRGTGAEIALPPTRSLARAKRLLAGLPGGGGTPLAAGLAAAHALAGQVRARGLTPALALLTDGRANVALSGAGGRAEAAEDARRLARLVAAERIPAVVLDTGARPSRDLKALAAAMGADHIPLPRHPGGAAAALDALA